MNGTAHIGPTISIKGEVTSQEPLTVAGHVDGSVEVTGHPLTIVQDGRAKGTLLAPTIVVSGSVDGSLCASDKVVVSATAVIEGDISAPVLSVAEGARVQGRIDTGERKAKPLHLAS